MTSDEAYVTANVIIRARTAKGVRLSPVDDPDHAVWIGRSCLHGADDMELNALKDGDETELRLFAWVARKENLI